MPGLNWRAAQKAERTQDEQIESCWRRLMDQHGHWHRMGIWRNLLESMMGQIRQWPQYNMMEVECVWQLQTWLSNGPRRSRGSS